MAAETSGRPSWAARLGWRIRPGRNPLVRGWDRLEGHLLLLVILVPLMVLPFAAALGSETYARESRVAATEASERHEALAVLVADAPATPLSAHGGASRDETSVLAEWRLPDGTRRTGTIRAEAGLPAGTEVPIWLDEDGDVVLAPRTATTAAWEGVAVAATLWLGAVAMCAMGFWLACRALDRRRFGQWEREWEDIDRQRSGF
ncbi:Rv1733c family protein [Qaidamihabitans albus]|uniref:Rv1733c family protein n=1 Tax=Qaidamihabitans albus TaxID=2795733 RepID=UPI0018F21E0B|nr:hypothetical protein [Qaidamihabitans albus]